METNKIRFKNLFKETRKLLKVTNVEKEQVYECMDCVIEALRQPINDINQVKKCSSFLSSFMHLLKAVVYENKIIEDENEELYSDKFSTLFSFYISLEVKRLKHNLEDPSRLNEWRNLVDKLVAKCRVYDDKNGNLAVKSLGKFLAQNELQPMADDDESSNKLKEAFCELFINLVSLKSTINTSYLPYYHQIFVAWLKIENDTERRKEIEKFASEQKIKATENGRLESMRQKILKSQMPKASSCSEIERDDDIFVNLSKDYFTLETLPWLSNLDKIPFSADSTVDLTIDSDDSDIEIELPPPVEVLEVIDDEQEKSRSKFNFPSRSPDQKGRIGIQERRSYINTIESLNDNEKPLSFSAFRRKSIMEEEQRRKRLETLRRKSCTATISKITPKATSRAKSVDVRVRSQSKNLSKQIQDCYVSLLRVDMKDIEKLKKGKLKILSFIRKYKKVEKALKEVPPKKNLKRPKKSQSAKKTSTPIKSSYPKRTQSNLKRIVSEVTKVPKRSSRRAKAKEISECNGQSESFDILRSSEPVEQESIRIVNADSDDIDWTLSDHQYAHSPWIDPLATIDANSLDNIDTQMQLDNLDISEIEQNDDLEVTSVNADLLQELLGPRASNYLPDVHASMNSSRISNQSRSSQSAENLVTPKKRKYTKRTTIERNERPKRVRRKRKISESE